MVSFLLFIFLSDILFQTARDFEISEVEQKLVQTKVELSLPLSLLDCIANYGTGMMRRRARRASEKAR